MTVRNSFWSELGVQYKVDFAFHINSFLSYIALLAINFHALNNFDNNFVPLNPT